MLLKVAHCGKSQIFVQIFLKSIFASEASNRRRPRSARPPAFFCDFLMKIVILPQCVQRQTWLRVMSVGQLIFPLSPFDAFSLPQGVPTVAFVYVNADSDMTVKQDLHFNLSFPTPC